MNKQAFEPDVIDIDVPSSADFVVMFFKPLLQASSSMPLSFHWRDAAKTKQ
jgi:hypothetical protein